MEMDELLISTGVDSLIRLIKENKKVELAMASKLLNISQSVIEDWAHILEEEGIIKIDYQLTKVYFSWITATETEVVREKEKFIATKRVVAGQVETLRATQDAGNRELADYAAEIDKVSERFREKFAKLDALWERLDTQKGKAAPASVAISSKVTDLSSKIDEINSSIKELESQLKETSKSLEGKGVEGKLEGMKDAKARMKALEGKTDALMEKVEAARKKMPKEQNINVGGIKTEFEGLRAHLERSRGESEYLRSITEEFKVNADTIKEALSSMKSLSQEAGKTNEGLNSALKQIEQLKKDLPAIEKKLREDIAVSDQYMQTVQAAQEVLKNVPAKEEISRRLDAISKDEKSLDEEFRKFESTLSGVSGNVLAVGDLIDELSDMKEEVENARTQLSEEADEILSSIDEETSTYATFQKIKAKTKMAVDAYLAQLAKIREEGKSAYAELEKLKSESAKYMKEAAAGISPEDASEAVQLISSLKEKRAELDKIRGMIADLSARSGMIEKNIRLLSKEAELISLREEGAQRGGKSQQQSPERAQRERETGEKVALASNEQEEFERKRKELKDLIRKLWETE